MNVSKPISIPRVKSQYFVKQKDHKKYEKVYKSKSGTVEKIKNHEWIKLNGGYLQSAVKMEEELNKKGNIKFENGDKIDLKDITHNFERLSVQKHSKSL